MKTTRTYAQTAVEGLQESPPQAGSVPPNFVRCCTCTRHHGTPGSANPSRYRLAHREPQTETNTHLARRGRERLAHLVCFMRIAASVSLLEPLPSLAALCGLFGDIAQRAAARRPTPLSTLVAGAAYSILALCEVR